MKLVAITSCATGIAHTYMAAEAIKRKCQEKGINCKVEMQGALGIEDEISKEDIENADIIIIASDIGISKAERFEGLEEKIKKFSPHEIVINTDIIFK